MKKIPDWMKMKLPDSEISSFVQSVADKYNLNTVCVSAKCPNLGECFGCQTATFLIGGSICTRNCRYCAVPTGAPQPLDESEPQNIAAAVKQLKLKHVVITSVTRDDLADGGASHFVACVNEVRKQTDCSVEILVPDFQGKKESLDSVFSVRPEIFNHNIEAAESVFKDVRPKGDYNLSLDILKEASNRGLIVKSGLMLGFGEKIINLKKTFIDLAQNGVKIITIGQYSQSTLSGIDVKKYYTPEEFNYVSRIASECGIDHVYSAPLIRSSYLAADIYKKFGGF